MIYFNKVLNYKVYGVDYSDKLKLTKNNLDYNKVKDYKLYKADFLNWKPNIKFDIVSSFGFIEHFDNPEHIIEKQIKLVEDKGYIVIGVPNFRYATYWFYYLFDKETINNHNLEIMNLNKLKKILENNKLNIIYANYYDTIYFGLKDIKCKNIFIKMIVYPLSLFARAINSIVKWPNKYFSPSMIIIAKKNK